MSHLKIGALAIALAILSVCCACVDATTVTMRAVMSPSLAGGGMSGVLVIVRGLDPSTGEVLRALTGAHGLAPELDVPPGLYEAIATDPYSWWQTSVRDFEVQSKPVSLDLPLSMEPDQRVDLNIVDWHVTVVDAKGRRVPNAWVIGRDPDATTGASVAKTDSRGSATVTIPMDDATIAVVYNGRSYSEHFQPDPGMRNCRWSCLDRAQAKMKKRRRTLTFSLD